MPRLSQCEDRPEAPARQAHLYHEAPPWAPTSQRSASADELSHAALEGARSLTTAHSLLLEPDLACSQSHGMAGAPGGADLFGIRACTKEMQDASGVHWT